MTLAFEFFRHNTMMNERLLDVCETLTPDQLAATVPGTFGSIRATLVHITNSQDGYAHRFLDRLRPPPVELGDRFEVLRASYERSNALLEEAAGRVGDGRLVQVSGDDPVGTWRMPGDLLLVQAVNHGTEHRSQIATILTTLGREPPAMDGWTYFFAAGHMIDVLG